MCLAVPGKVVSIAGEAELRTGRVDFGGITRGACLAYVPEAKVGDYVVVHVGVAISIVDAAEATQTLEYLKQMGALAELNGHA